MQKYSRKKLAAAFVELLERHPRHQVIAALARELLQQKMSRDIDNFMRDVARELLTRQGHLAVSISSAHELSRSLRDEIGDVLRRHAGAKTVQVVSTRDPAVQGKFVASSPAGELDASVATQLNYLKEKF